MMFFFRFVGWFLDEYLPPLGEPECRRGYASRNPEIIHVNFSWEYCDELEITDMSHNFQSNLSVGIGAELVLFLQRELARDAQH